MASLPVDLLEISAHIEASLLVFIPINGATASIFTVFTVRNTAHLQIYSAFSAAYTGICYYYCIYINKDSFYRSTSKQKSRSPIANLLQCLVPVLGLSLHPEKYQTHSHVLPEQPGSEFLPARALLLPRG